MDKPSDHVTRIQKQFERQGKAYSRLAYVSDDKGLQRVVAMARLQPDDRVLDVACGPGFLTMAFAGACAKAVGADATATFLQAAREEAENRGIDNIEFQQEIAEALSFEDGAFDVVVCRAAFHHFVEPGNVLAQMKRVCKPGGKILVLDMIRSEDPDKAAYHDTMEKLCDPTHVKCLTEPEFEALFNAEGLSIVHTGRGGTSYTLTEWIRHGGPTSEDEATIRAMMHASLNEDKSGLEIREEDGELHFSHAGLGYVLQKPA